MKPLDFTSFLRPLRECGVVVVEAVLTPHSRTELARWDHERICVIRRGQLACVTESGTLDLVGGEIVYLRAGTRHQWIAGEQDQVSLLTICFEPEFFRHIKPMTELFCDFDRLFGQSGEAEKLHRAEGAALRSILKSVMRAKRGQEKQAPAELIGLFIELIGRLVSVRGRVGSLHRQSQGLEAFRMSVSYLNDHISERLTVKQLADMSGLSSRRYLDVFKSEFGMSPKQYMVEKRLDIAKALITETGNIIFSSLDAGFENLSHFYRTFKKHTGMTPREYLKQKRKGA